MTVLHLLNEQIILKRESTCRCLMKLFIIKRGIN